MPTLVLLAALFVSQPPDRLPVGAFDPALPTAVFANLPTVAFERAAPSAPVGQPAAAPLPRLLHRLVDPPARSKPEWLTDYDKAVAARDHLNRPVVILFTDPSRCLPCRRLEAEALSDEPVKVALSTHVCLRVVLDGDEGRAELARKLGVASIPTLMRFDRDGVLTGGPLTPDARGRVASQAVLDLLLEKAPPPAPPPASTRPVDASAGPGLAYNPTHTCPNPRCRRQQFVIETFLPGGAHIHRCAACGTAWYHQTP